MRPSSAVAWVPVEPQCRSAWWGRACDLCVRVVIGGALRSVGVA
jgi:hypothetical protein